MEEFWKLSLSIAGLGAIASFVLLSLYKQWLKLDIFQKLTKSQQFILFIIFLFLTFLFALSTLGAYVYINVHEESKSIAVESAKSNPDVKKVSEQNNKKLSVTSLTKDQNECSTSGLFKYLNNDQLIIKIEKLKKEQNYSCALNAINSMRDMVRQQEECESMIRFLIAEKEICFALEAVDSCSMHIDEPWFLQEIELENQKLPQEVKCNEINTL
ncbi:MAG: hypothetical protein H6976_16610 [Gammaproteobacteria bacterium]|nr:hypothetical protein [Gammaproteobacteria bacterium]